MTHHYGCPRDRHEVRIGCCQKLIFDLGLYDGLSYLKKGAKILVDTDDEVPIHGSVIEFTKDSVPKLWINGCFLIKNFKIVYSPPKQDTKTFDEILYKHRQTSLEVNLLHLHKLILSLNYYYHYYYYF